MADRPLLCTRCAAPVEIVEDVTGYIGWGPAVIGADGVVRPTIFGSTFLGDAGAPLGRPRACCSACGHQWRLRRPFEPTAEPITQRPDQGGNHTTETR